MAFIVYNVNEWMEWMIGAGRDKSVSNIAQR